MEKGLGYDPTQPRDERVTALTERYGKVRDAQERWNSTAMDNRRLWAGAHYTSEQLEVLEERGQPPIAIQIVYQIVEQAVAMLTARRPSTRALPREDSDPKLARVWSDLFAWHWEQSDLAGEMKNIFRDHYTVGRGVQYVFTDWNADDGRGEVLSCGLNPTEVYPDPACKDPLWRDAKDIYVARWMTEDRVKSLWPKKWEAIKKNAVPSEIQVNGSTVRQEHNGEYVWEGEMPERDYDRTMILVLERFEKRKEEFYRVYVPDTGKDKVVDGDEYDRMLERPAFIIHSGGGQQIVTEPDRVAALNEQYQQYGPVSHIAVPPMHVTPTGRPIQPEPMRQAGPAGQSAVRGSETTLEPTTMKYLIESLQIPVTPFMQDRVWMTTVVGDYWLQDVKLPTQHYPVIPYPDAALYNPYPIAAINRIKDLQDLINKVHSLVVTYVANVTNLKVFVPRGSVDRDNLERDWNKAGASIMEYDPDPNMSGPGIYIPPIPPLPQSVEATIARAIGLIERILGVFNSQQGDVSQAPETHKATIALDEFGLRRIKARMDDLFRSMNQAARVFMDLAVHTYTSEKVVRLINPNGEVSQSRINTYTDYSAEAEKVNDLQSSRYDLIVVSGSTLPSNRSAMHDKYLELFAAGIVDDVAVLRNSDVPDADEILERKSMLNQLQQGLAQAEEQIKKLEGDMQTLEREKMTAREKAEIEKFKAGLREIQAGMSAASKVSKVQMDMANLRQSSKDKDAQKDAVASK